MLRLSVTFKIMVILTLVSSFFNTAMSKLLFVCFGFLTLCLSLIVYGITTYVNYDVRNLITRTSEHDMLGYIKVMVSSGMSFKKAISLYVKNTEKLNLSLYILLPIVVLIVGLNWLLIIAGYEFNSTLNFASQFSVIVYVVVFGLYRYQTLKHTYKKETLCLVG